MCCLMCSARSGYSSAGKSRRLVAVFGSRIVWDVLHRDREYGSDRAAEDFECLFWALALIADNGALTPGR